MFFISKTRTYFTFLMLSAHLASCSASMVDGNRVSVSGLMFTDEEFHYAAFKSGNANTNGEGCVAKIDLSTRDYIWKLISKNAVEINKNEMNPETALYAIENQVGEVLVVFSLNYFKDFSGKFYAIDKESAFKSYDFLMEFVGAPDCWG